MSLIKTLKEAEQRFSDIVAHTNDPEIVAIASGGESNIQDTLSRAPTRSYDKENEKHKPVLPFGTVEDCIDGDVMEDEMLVGSDNVYISETPLYSHPTMVRRLSQAEEKKLLHQYGLDNGHPHQLISDVQDLCMIPKEAADD